MKKQHSPKARQAINVLELNHRHRQFDYQEVYRSIRTNIEFSSLDASARAIALTSCQPFEAKTTTAFKSGLHFRHEIRPCVINRLRPASAPDS